MTVRFEQSGGTADVVYDHHTAVAKCRRRRVNVNVCFLAPLRVKPLFEPERDSSQLAHAHIWREGEGGGGTGRLSIIISQKKRWFIFFPLVVTQHALHPGHRGIFFIFLLV